MKSFIYISETSDFTLHNIPFGVFEKEGYHGICTRVGDTLIDLHQCLSTAIFEGIELPENIFNQRYINSFIALGKSVTKEVRLRLQTSLQTGGFLRSLRYLCQSMGSKCCCRYK